MSYVNLAPFQLLDLLGGIQRNGYHAVVLQPHELESIRAMDLPVQPVRPTLPALSTGTPRRT